MLTLNLIADIVKMWAERQTIAKLKEYAASPTPDVQFTMPLVNVEVDIWIVDSPKPPTYLPKNARRLKSIQVGDAIFWLFYAIKGKKNKLV